jgi:hypothetical protein
LQTQVDEFIAKGLLHVPAFLVPKKGWLLARVLIVLGMLRFPLLQFDDLLYDVAED